MPNRLLFLILLLVLVACEAGDETEADNKEKTGLVPETPNPEKAAPNPSSKASQGGLPIELEEALDLWMSEWEIIPEALWLNDRYLRTYGDSMGFKVAPKYKQQIYVQSDLNGDGEDDFAVFLINAAENAGLYALLSGPNGFEPLLLQEEGVLEDCCLAAGVEIASNAEYEVLEGGNARRIVRLFHDGLTYTRYGKARYLFRMDPNGSFLRETLFEKSSPNGPSEN